MRHIKKYQNSGPAITKKTGVMGQSGDTLKGRAAAAELKRRKESTKNLMEYVPPMNPKARAEWEASKKTSAPKKKMKTGGKQMMKRADGSVSPRGLWDNIRAAAKRNKAAGKPGKKPTAAMLKQERRIKAKGK